MEILLEDSFLELELDVAFEGFDSSITFQPLSRSASSSDKEWKEEEGEDGLTHSSDVSESLYDFRRLPGFGGTDIQMLPQRGER